MKEPIPTAGDSTPRQTTLAALVEALAAGGEERGRDFVRRVAAWMDAIGPRVSLPFVERLGLVDVVATLHMKQRVHLVVTGALGSPPAEVTVRIDERDFPFVAVAVLAAPRDAPYTFCTLDFGPRGRRARLVGGGEDGVAEPPGTEGRCQVVSTHGDRLFVRVELPDGRVVLWPAERVELE